MKYETLRWIALGTIIAYTIIPTVGRGIFGAENLYPFFSWYLFSDIPNEQHTYTMRILSYGPQTYTPAVEFDKTRGLFDALKSPPTLFTPLIRQLGTVLTTSPSDETTIRDLRTHIERMFMNTRARYEIVRVSYDLLRYWHTHTYDFETVIAVFDTATP